MSDEDILIALKTDLGISVTQRDDYLKKVIALARKSIEREGVVLQSNDIEEGMLIAMYAAYLYRARKNDDTTMPRSLRYALNNMLFSQKGKVE